MEKIQILHIFFTKFRRKLKFHQSQINFHGDLGAGFLFYTTFYFFTNKDLKNTDTDFTSVLRSF